MHLYLLRHGIAEERDPERFPDDKLRPLTARGEKQLRKVAKALARVDQGIDLIWTSPLLRTRQTAAAVAKRLAGKDRLELCEHLAPEGDPRKLLREIARLDPMPDNLLLVGHEPYLSGLLSVLTSGKSTVRARLKKGGLAKLEASGPPRFGQCATLLWLIPPKLLVTLS